MNTNQPTSLAVFQVQMMRMTSSSTLFLDPDYVTNLCQNRQGGTYKSSWYIDANQYHVNIFPSCFLGQEDMQSNRVMKNEDLYYDWFEWQHKYILLHTDSSSSIFVICFYFLILKSNCVTVCTFQSLCAFIKLQVKLENCSKWQSYSTGLIQLHFVPRAQTYHWLLSTEGSCPQYPVISWVILLPVKFYDSIVATHVLIILQKT